MVTIERSTEKRCPDTGSDARSRNVFFNTVFSLHSVGKSLPRGEKIARHFVNIYSTQLASAELFVIPSNALTVEHHDLAPARIFLEDVEANVAANERRAARRLMDGVEKRLSQKRMAEVDYICRNADFSVLGAYSAIAIVKSTYRCRGILPSWEFLLKKASSFLDANGVSSREIFSHLK